MITNTSTPQAVFSFIRQSSAVLSRTKEDVLQKNAMEPKCGKLRKHAYIHSSIE